jgi:hypothetical protein
MNYPNQIMKNRAAIILLSLIMAFGHPAAAQEVIRQTACENQSIVHQIDSLKQLFAKDGFIVVKEASMSMESEYEMPVIVPLREGTWYRFIFVGDITSKIWESRMYDWNEKQVMYQKKMWADVDGNVVNYDYIPRFTEYHMIKVSQVNKTKKKNICGYVMLLKKVKE